MCVWAFFVVGLFCVLREGERQRRFCLVFWATFVRARVRLGQKTRVCRFSYHVYNIRIVS